ncbi:hypothetical protein L1276_004291 [Flavobacterium sp. HSC-32F16]|uniref:hypothetical protein n=1 Tax=Flavobacterium sp. HSC-32F16 TaxID=2910964 RepID=UPI0020A47079|nr:hypothetical protein [Flavobacterium sp. HSC-32F16]MCP2029112.1 hypothetical protein [Flavobacterium sp. HSC-32F16]
MKRLKYSFLLGLATSFFLTVFFYFKEDIPLNVLFVAAVFILFLITLISYFKMFAHINNEEMVFKKLKNVIYSGRANHFLSNISVGGNLSLADNQLVFQTNIINFLQKHECIINLEDITAVEFEKTLGIANNGLLIKTKNGNEQFVVTKREIWKSEIEKRVKNST